MHQEVTFSSRTNGRDRKTHHFIINLVEVDFANFIYDVLALKCDESKTCNKKSAKLDVSRSSSIVSARFVGKNSAVCILRRKTVFIAELSECRKFRQSFQGS